jgi:hypothetical protein
MAMFLNGSWIVEHVLALEVDVLGHADNVPALARMHPTDAFVEFQLCMMLAEGASLGSLRLEDFQNEAGEWALLWPGLFRHDSFRYSFVASPFGR